LGHIACHAEPGRNPFCAEQETTMAGKPMNDDREKSPSPLRSVTRNRQEQPQNPNPTDHLPEGEDVMPQGTEQSPRDRESGQELDEGNKGRRLEKDKAPPTEDQSGQGERS
jgi:hypothetical protein